MSRNPPSDRARVDMFLSSVRSYESFAGIFELPTDITLAFAGLEERDREYWLFVTHGALLRKYIQGGDNLAFSKVIQSIKACLDVSDVNVSRTWAVLEAEAAEIPTGGGIEYRVGDNEIDPKQLALDDLYGSLLYGDYDRWARNTRGGGMSQFALVDWVNDVAHFVVAIKQYWELAERDGLVIA